MRICGVIAEYDPFHLGHAHHLRAAREASGADYVVCVLSGCFTQRGRGAMVAPAVRAEMALRGGADAVLELPVPWAVREAEHFALGGVSMLSRLGCVTDLAFGAECGDTARLSEAAALLESPPPGFDDQVKRGLAQGLSHPAAVDGALAQALGSGFSAPNDVLGLCYLRALRRLRSPIRPVAIPRVGGGYHDTALSPAFPSATALRGACQRGAWMEAERGLPGTSSALLRRETLAGRRFSPEKLDVPLLLLLRQTPPEVLDAFPGCGEGLGRRLRDAAQEAVTARELLALAKTKRYPYARLSRLCTQLLLGLGPVLTPGTLPPYGRLLGFRRDAGPLLRAMKNGSLPLLEKAADANRSDPVLRADARAYDLWCLGASLPAGLLYTQRIAIV